MAYFGALPNNYNISDGNHLPHSIIIQPIPLAVTQEITIESRTLLSSLFYSILLRTEQDAEFSAWTSKKHASRLLLFLAVTILTLTFESKFLVHLMSFVSTASACTQAWSLANTGPFISSSTSIYNVNDNVHQAYNNRIDISTVHPMPVIQPGSPHYFHYLANISLQLRLQHFEPPVSSNLYQSAKRG